MKPTIFHRMVRDFFEHRYRLEQSLLILGDIKGEDVTFYTGTLKNLSLKEAIIEILRLCNQYKTFDYHTREYQCKAGARRSMIDVWRLLKYYYRSDLDITDVIWCIQSEMLREEGHITAIFCHDIERFVMRQGLRGVCVILESKYTEFGFRIGDLIYEED